MIRLVLKRWQSVMRSPAKKAIDRADLLALEVSFSDDDSTASGPFAVKSSPVRLQNKQFENDFFLDLSEGEEFGPFSGKSAQESIPVPSSSPVKIKLSQINVHRVKRAPVDDFEDVFSDSDPEPQFKSDVQKDRSLAISAPETSSPSYHRRETIHVRRAPPPPPPTFPQPNSRILDELDSLDDGPLITSTQNTEMQPPPPAIQPKAAEPTNFTRQGSKPPLYPDMSEYGAQSKDSSRYVSGINSVLQRKRNLKKNSELLLLTQRPTIFDQKWNKSDDQKKRDFATTGLDTRAKGKVIQPITLSEEQKRVEDLVKRGESLFYTGSAGTGKSVLLRSIIKALRAQHRGVSDVCVTASTGLAAVHIGGITLHSFAGIGLGKGEVGLLIKKVKTNRKAATRWRECKVLIIDEISMISGELFDKLDAIARGVRRNQRPFGGIQVIACGDFFQLPPVVKEDEPIENVFCFDSNSWKRVMKKTIVLKQVFRQKGDLEFIEMLNEMRLGNVSDNAVRKFRELERDLPDDDIEPAELYSTRAEVERANENRLNRLPHPEIRFHATDGGYEENEQIRAKLLGNFMAPELLVLKKNAQVMMIKNIDETLVNGSLGKVIDFIDRDTFLAYDSLQENPECSVDAVERQVEAAKTKQESEQKTILKEEDAPFEPGMPNSGPVEELEDTIFGFMDQVDSQDPEVLENIERKKKLINELHMSSRGQKLPLVRFLTPNGSNRTILVNPETWVVEDVNQRPIVSRLQLPLILAWSLSIHKSQGQTLPRVRVNLKKVFEKGQAYVAISRAVSREGLQLLNFDPSKVFAHKRVKDFYNSLQSIDEAEDDIEMENVKKPKEMAPKIRHKRPYDQPMSPFIMNRDRVPESIDFEEDNDVDYIPDEDDLLCAMPGHYENDSRAKRTKNRSFFLDSESREYSNP